MSECIFPSILGRKSRGKNVLHLNLFDKMGILIYYINEIATTETE